MFAEKLIVNNMIESSVSLRSNFVYSKEWLYIVEISFFYFHIFFKQYIIFYNTYIMQNTYVYIL